MAPRLEGQSVGRAVWPDRESPVPDGPGMTVLVRPARERGDYDACVRLQREVWGLSDLEITSAIQLVATVHAGGSLLVAESAGDIVGFCYAFAALRGNEAHLHSDMLAVHPAARGRGVGPRLKWAQREEALRRSLRLVTWTFDPMRAGNARLNLHRLGAVAREFLPDFYGTTSSALHHGLATDRLLVRWELDRARVARRAAGGAVTSPAFDALPAINEVKVSGRGEVPVSSPPRLDLDGKELLLEIPDDWDAVVRADAGLAREWQDVVRRAFESLFARGYEAAGFVSTEGARPRVGYVLRRDREEG
jgi:predicted GNAT superfamily acetyltransferase